jgi:hypothetical protein
VGSAGVVSFPVFSGDLFLVMLKDPRLVERFPNFLVMPIHVLDAVSGKVFVKIYVEVGKVKGECIKFFFCGICASYATHARLFRECVTVHPSATQS